MDTHDHPTERTTYEASGMNKTIEGYAVPIVVGVACVASVAAFVYVCFWKYNGKKEKKKSTSVKITPGSVSEMAQAFDQASVDRSPVITGRQKVRQRVKDEVSE